MREFAQTSDLEPKALYGDYSQTEPHQMESRLQANTSPTVLGTQDLLATIDSVIAANRSVAGALLPMLHGIQDLLGYVPSTAVPRLADALNLSQAEVHGVLSFYHDFRTVPPGRHILRLCRAEACQAMGCNALETHLQKRHGLSFHETSTDGAVTLEPVYCLGNCACAPSLLVDGEVRGRVTSEKLDRWIQELRANAGGNP